MTLVILIILSVLNIGGAIYCSKKASKLNRNAAVWGFFGFIMPILAIICIQFMKLHHGEKNPHSAENKTFKNNKLIFLLSLIVSVFFIFIYLNDYVLQWDFVLIGVFRELLTIPCWIGELILLFFAIRGFVLSKYSFKSYPIWTILILLINILFTWGGFVDTTTGKSTPRQVNGLTGITAIAGGSRNSLVLCNDSTVSNWGNNQWNQLGDGTTTDRATPVKALGLKGIITIAGGECHSLALKKDSTVWAWGLNNQCQLGDGVTTHRPTPVRPVQVSGLKGITAIAGGGSHSLALKKDSTVWAWGFSGNYQLGDGTNKPIGCCRCKSIPVQVSGLTGITAIAGAYKYSLALKNDGTVWLWGQHNKDQLWGGVPVRRTPVQMIGLTEITAIAGGQYHSLALKKDGTVWAWGENDDGQLGDGTTTHRITPVQVSGLTGITAIAGGGSHSLALKKDGTVWAWGENDDGQLGDGTTTHRITPVQVSGLTGITAIAGGGGFSLALKKDGTVWAWGDNDYGQLGDDTTTK